jgi:hypothetical protein
MSFKTIFKVIHGQTTNFLESVKGLSHLQVHSEFLAPGGNLQQVLERNLNDFDEEWEGPFIE